MKLSAVRLSSLTLLLLAGLSVGAAGDRRVAVTIDDLPAVSVPRGTSCAAESLRAFTGRLLEQLVTCGVPATGFVVPGGLCHALGEGFLKELLESWLNAGMQLGNHTHSHPDLNHTPIVDYLDDIRSAETLLRPLLAERGLTLEFFRHPCLHTGKDSTAKTAVEAFLRQAGYTVAPVTIDSDEYIFARVYAQSMERGDPDTQHRVAQAYVLYMERVIRFCEDLSRATLGFEPPQVLLLHANALNADHFAELAAMLRRRGYRFVDLREALEDEAYRLPDTYTGPHGLSWLQRWALGRGMELRAEPEVPDWIAASF